MKIRWNKTWERGHPARKVQIVNSMHRNWHSRGYLPHFDSPGYVQAVTFRLADALPSKVVDDLASEAMDDANRCRKIEELMDTGHGRCWLRQPEVAVIVEDALLHFDGERYRLLSWCIMPNHVHVMIETKRGHPLGEVVHTWKSYSANVINRHIGRDGKFWQEDYFDRYIRDDTHYLAAVAYIENNPVQAGLVHSPEEWPFSSATRREKGKPC